VSPRGPALSATQASIAVLDPAVSGSVIERAAMATRQKRRVSASESPGSVVFGRPEGVERRLQDRLVVAAVSSDLGDGADHVEDLLEGEIDPDLA
jgi:hypothetical protein